MSCVYFAAILTILPPRWRQNRYCLLYIMGHGPVQARKYVVVWHKRAGQFHVSSGQACLQNCWPVPSLLLGQVTICWQLYNPVPPHTEMYERSIFPFLHLFLSFEMNFSTPRSQSD